MWKSAYFLKSGSFAETITKNCKKVIRISSFLSKMFLAYKFFFNHLFIFYLLFTLFLFSYILCIAILPTSYLLLFYILFIAILHLIHSYSISYSMLFYILFIAILHIIHCYSTYYFLLFYIQIWYRTQNKISLGQSEQVYGEISSTKKMVCSFKSATSTIFRDFSFKNCEVSDLTFGWNGENRMDHWKKLV